MVGHKTNSRKLKLYQACARLQWLETGNQPQGKNSKHSNTWRLNNMLIKNEWVNNEIKEE